MLSTVLILLLVLSADLARKPSHELTGVVVAVDYSDTTTVLDHQKLEHTIRLNAIDA